MSFQLNKNQPNWNSKKTYLPIIGVLVMVFLFLLYSSRDETITLNKDNMEISGYYGVNIKYTDIALMDTSRNMPNIEKRTNGFSFGNYKKGYYNLSGIGNAKLFMNFNNPLFIRIKLKNQETFFFNYKEISPTIEQYNKIKERIK